MLSWKYKSNKILLIFNALTIETFKYLYICIGKNYSRRPWWKMSLSKISAFRIFLARVLRHFALFSGTLSPFCSNSFSFNSFFATLLNKYICGFSRNRERRHYFPGISFFALHKSFSDVKWIVSKKLGFWRLLDKTKQRNPIYV